MIKRKKSGCQPPEYSKPTPPPPPTSGSNAFISNLNYVPPASIKQTCIYSTPCGWCTKWDKKCDKKIPELLTNQTCTSECDHEWECCGISTLDTYYICKKCNACKVVPREEN